MRDRSCILPTNVVKIIHPPPGVSWVSRDQELNVEHKYIGFDPALSCTHINVIYIKEAFLGPFCQFLLLFEGFFASILN